MRDTIARLAGARGAGTEAEAVAREWVRGELAGFGYAVAELPVAYDPWLVRRGLTVLLFAIAAALGYALVHPGGEWALAVGIAMGIPVLSAVTWGRPRWDRGTRVQSANLVATQGEPRLWIVAHLDTKSQRLSFVARTVAAIVTFVGLAAFVAARAAGAETVAFTCGAAAVAAVLALAFSGHGDASPGANDNASGVALLLELARRFAHEPSVGFLVPTGEEDGLVGADRFVRSRPPVRERPFVVNLDTVGCPPLLLTGHRVRPYRRGSRGARLHDAMVRAAADVPHRERAVPFPAAVDSFVFHRAGYPALTLAGGTIGNTYRFVHRPADTAGRLDAAWMARVADVAERGVRDVLGLPVT